MIDSKPVLHQTEITPIESRSVDYRHGALAYEGKARPVDRQRLITKLLKEVEFGLTQGGTFIGTLGEVLVETLHQGDGVDVVGGPQAGWYAKRLPACCLAALPRSTPAC